ncbi:MAG: hypothetical protein ACWGPS_11655, partial [Candidatus Promineifilaceae bacterium]
IFAWQHMELAGLPVAHLRMRPPPLSAGGVFENALYYERRKASLDAGSPEAHLRLRPPLLRAGGVFENVLSYERRKASLDAG